MYSVTPQAATVMVADSGAPNSPGSEAQSAASGATAKLKWHQKFARQQFQGWRPILNVSSAQMFFVSAGIFCIALGIPILTASLTVINYEARYDDTGAFQGLSNDAAQALMWQNAAAPNGVPLEVEIAVDSDMEPPVRKRGRSRSCTAACWLCSVLWVQGRLPTP